MRHILLALSLGALLPWQAGAQTQPRQVAELLQPELQTPDVVAVQLRNYLMKKVPRLPAAGSAEEWTREAVRLRRRALEEVVFHGWPREWVDAPPRFEDLGPIPSGPGYRMRKLRYEIVPGFYSTAILYEPEAPRGKAPAILNVNGHVGAPGKSVEYKQKRCIHQARQGIFALNLEWLAFGELAAKENQHWFGAHLDLVGANAVGLFYLAMRRGLDYLHQHPDVDPSRIGVTGLSGGGWQTVVLSGLDQRVAVAVPVAGYSAVTARIERPADIGDIEQNATDLLTVADYSHLTALRAPRPTLLIYNAEDDCCFRAPLVKPDIFDRVRPFFRLFGQEANLAWHENTDPSDHNYQRDNRIQAYRFFARHFGLPVPDTETPVDAEIKSYEELVVGLPQDNLTILGLARKLAVGIERTPAGRAELAATLRHKPVKVAHAWALDNTKRKELETRSYRFEFDNGLSATGLWLKAIAAAEKAPVTVTLNDQGKKNGQAAVSDRVNRGEQALAVDLLFTGDAAPQKPGPHSWTQLLATLGDRPLGLEAAQLAGIVSWLGRRPARVETSGIRSELVALATAALEPGLFSEIVIRDGMRSLQHLLDAPVPYQTAPDLFCLDLYQRFDVDRLVELAAPAKVVWK
jgi:dienelactone hydrolase